MEHENLVPEHTSGKRIDAKSFREFPDTQLAKRHFENAKSWLLDMNHWDEIASDIMATFKLCDENGNHIDQIASIGLPLRIDIPGPGSADGAGYDWVRIEDINETSEGDFESIAIMVRPMAAPGTSQDSTAHFYSEDSTSTFVICRRGKTIEAAVYDRNIDVNRESDSLIGKLRNMITGFIAKEGFSKSQWQALTDGLVG